MEKKKVYNIYCDESCLLLPLFGLIPQKRIYRPHWIINIRMPKKTRFVGEVHNLRQCGRKNKSQATSFTL